THSFDSAGKIQQSTGKAFDAVLGRLTSGNAGAVGNQIGRFGGDMTALSNGNFLVVADDLSNLINTSGRAATAVIVAADGSIVQDSFVIGPGELWSNVCAFKGGFCVRLSGQLLFYDNSGNFQGGTDQNDAALPDFTFDRGRGDGTRIASHINSNYVFLAGSSNGPTR